MIETRTEIIERLLGQAARTSDRFVRGVILAEVEAELRNTPQLAHLLVDLERVRREAEAHP